MSSALNWDTYSIQRQWQPIDFDSPTSLSPIEREYCQFYGLDFENEFTRFVHAFGYCEVADFRLATHYFRPQTGRSKGTMVLLHGYFDHSGLFTHLIRFCLERDLSVVIYDLPGHGLSTGEPAGIDGFHHYVDILHHYIPWCQRNFDDPLYLLGQSTGGAIAMAYLMEKGFTRMNSPFKNVFLLAPLVRPVQWKKLIWLYKVSKHWAKSVQRKFMDCSHDEQFIKFLQTGDPLQYQRIPLTWVTSLINWANDFEKITPSLLSPIVIQGGEDSTIDWRYNLSIIDQKFDRPQVHYFPQARHHLVNESVEIRNRVFQILEANIVI